MEDIPDTVEVFMYSGQKLNIYEFQKERLRKKLSHDKTKFFTYSPDHLGLSFPLVNEHEIEAKAKAENQMVIYFRIKTIEMAH